MTAREKKVTYELTVSMPENTNLNWVAGKITGAIEKAMKEQDGHFSVNGVYLLSES